MRVSVFVFIKTMCAESKYTKKAWAFVDIQCVFLDSFFPFLWDKTQLPTGKRWATRGSGGDKWSQNTRDLRWWNPSEVGVHCPPMTPRLSPARQPQRAHNALLVLLLLLLLLLPGEIKISEKALQRKNQRQETRATVELWAKKITDGYWCCWPSLMFVVLVGASGPHLRRIGRNEKYIMWAHVAAVPSGLWVMIALTVQHCFVFAFTVSFLILRTFQSIFSLFLIAISIFWNKTSFLYSVDTMTN